MEELARPGPSEVLLQRRSTFATLRQVQAWTISEGNRVALTDVVTLYLYSLNVDTVEELAERD